MKTMVLVSWKLLSFVIVQFQKISTLPLPPPPLQKGLEFPWGGVLQDQKKLKKCMGRIWNFQRGRDILENVLSMGEMCIFSGITQLWRQSAPARRHVPVPRQSPVSGSPAVSEASSSLSITFEDRVLDPVLASTPHCTRQH